MNYQETLSWMFNRLPMFQTQGKNALNNKLDNILTFTSESGEKSYFLLKSDSSIILVGEDGKEPKMAAQYTLTKQVQ